MTTRILGASFAATAAIIAVVGVTTATPVAAKGAAVHCSGINSCKGVSDRKTAANEYKGQNACKGEGFRRCRPRSAPRRAAA